MSLYHAFGLKTVHLFFAVIEYLLLLGTVFPKEEIS